MGYITVKEDGVKRYNNDGILHCTFAPAVEYPSGTQMWYEDGELHRTDAPAIITASGNKYWYFHGKLHRENGPAIEYADGSKEWWVLNRRHRTDGPAIERVTSVEKEWWVDGVIMPTPDNVDVDNSIVITWDEHYDNELVGLTPKGIKCVVEWQRVEYFAYVNYQLVGSSKFLDDAKLICEKYVNQF